MIFLILKQFLPFRNMQQVEEVNIWCSVDIDSRKTIRETVEKSIGDAVDTNALDATAEQ